VPTIQDEMYQITIGFEEITFFKIYELPLSPSPRRSEFWVKQGPYEK
jgi:hypothetical protein